MTYGYIKTEAAYLNWIRSSLRKVWTKHPVRLGLIQAKRFRKLNPKSGRMAFHITCEHCGKSFLPAKIEANHKNTVGELTIETIGLFAERLLNVREEDVEILCKDCHGIVTYSERQNCSLEEAKYQKMAIAFSKKPAAKQRDLLIKYGIEPAKNALERREQAFMHYKRKK